MPDLIRECSNPACLFRFPESAHPSRGLICPVCGSPTAIVAAAGYPDEGQISHSIPQGIHPVHVLLDNIRSTYNVGSIFRTSDGAAVEHIYLCGVTPTPRNPKIAKTALGAEFSVPWSTHNNSLKIALECKDKGMLLVALEISQNSQSIFNLQPGSIQQPILLIVGNEVSGIDSGLLQMCEFSLDIPMYGYKKSLNVAAAYSIAIYQLRFLEHISHHDRI